MIQNHLQGAEKCLHLGTLWLIIGALDIRWLTRRANDVTECGTMITRVTAGCVTEWGHDNPGYSRLCDGVGYHDNPGYSRLCDGVGPR